MNNPSTGGDQARRGKGGSGQDGARGPVVRKSIEACRRGRPQSFFPKSSVVNSPEGGVGIGPIDQCFGSFDFDWGGVYTLGFDMAAILDAMEDPETDLKGSESQGRCRGGRPRVVAVACNDYEADAMNTDKAYPLFVMGCKEDMFKIQEIVGRIDWSRPEKTGGGGTSEGGPDFLQALDVTLQTFAGQWGLRTVSTRRQLYMPEIEKTDDVQPEETAETSKQWTEKRMADLVQSKVEDMISKILTEQSRIMSEKGRQEIMAAAQQERVAWQTYGQYLPPCGGGGTGVPQVNYGGVADMQTHGQVIGGGQYQGQQHQGDILMGGCAGDQHHQQQTVGPMTAMTTGYGGWGVGAPGMVGQYAYPGGHVAHAQHMTGDVGGQGGQQGAMGVGQPPAQVGMVSNPPLQHGGLGPGDGQRPTNSMSGGTGAVVGEHNLNNAAPGGGKG